MTAQEFRIGNIVNQGIILSLGTTRVAIDNTPNISHWLYKAVEPIPLTEEWLIKFGFDKRHERWENDLGSGDYFYGHNDKYLIFYYERHECVAHWRIYYYGEKREGKKKHDCNQFGDRMKYVHQLQNLYFCLTGEELIVKEECDCRFMDIDGENTILEACKKHEKDYPKKN